MHSTSYRMKRTHNLEKAAPAVRRCAARDARSSNVSAKKYESPGVPDAVRHDLPCRTSRPRHTRESPPRLPAYFVFSPAWPPASHVYPIDATDYVLPDRRAIILDLQTSGLRISKQEQMLSPRRLLQKTTNHPSSERPLASPLSRGTLLHVNRHKKPRSLSLPVPVARSGRIPDSSAFRPSMPEGSLFS